MVLHEFALVTEWNSISHLQKICSMNMAAEYDRCEYYDENTVTVVP